MISQHDVAAISVLENGQDQHQQQTHRNICRFYRQGTCKHGLTGCNCPQEHPPPCRRLMKHGNRSPQGCTSGRACEYFHPKMCPTSLSKRECFKADCKLKHIMGTKRKQPAVSQEANRTSPDDASTPDRNYFFRGNAGHADGNYERARPTAGSATEYTPDGHGTGTGISSTHGTDPDHANTSAGGDSMARLQRLRAGIPVATRAGNRRPPPHSRSRSQHQSASRAGADPSELLTSFTIFNIQGLKPRTVPTKVPFLQDLLQHSNQLFVALTETWLQEHLDAELQVDGYTLFR